MAVVRFELQGLKETLAKLMAMDKSVRRRALRKGVRAGAAELRKTAKLMTPRSKAEMQQIGQKGLLKRSITSKVAKAKKKNVVLAIIGPKRGMKVEGANPAKYAHLVENDTAPRTIKPKYKPKLVYRKNGMWRVAGEVNHPGTRGQQFLKRASVFAGQAAARAFRNKVAVDVVAQAKKKNPELFDDGH